jgi:cation transport regulator ChaC
MNRHYYISDNLNDLETVENELEASGINSEQIHVLSEKVADVEQHHLHEVN